MTCNELVDSYVSTIRESIHCRPTNGRLAMVFPFLYPDHDNVEMFVRESQDYMMVSDLGQTLAIGYHRTRLLCKRPNGFSSGADSNRL